MTFDGIFFRRLAAFGLACAAWPSGLAAAEPEGIEFFENHIRPLLVQNCYKCHSEEAGKAKGELLLDTRAGPASRAATPARRSYPAAPRPAC